MAVVLSRYVRVDFMAAPNGFEESRRDLLVKVLLHDGRVMAAAAQFDPGCLLVSYIR